MLACARHCEPCAGQQPHPCPHIPRHKSGGSSHEESSGTHLEICGQHLCPVWQRPVHEPGISSSETKRSVLHVGSGRNVVVVVVVVMKNSLSFKYENSVVPADFNTLPSRTVHIGSCSDPKTWHVKPPQALPNSSQRFTESSTFRFLLSPAAYLERYFSSCRAHPSGTGLCR
jgi:hypothetical protein